MNIPDVRPNYYEPNYDREKIAPYTLEDPLQFIDGSRVQSAADWQRRRAEILDVFAKNMFGEEPPRPETVIAELIEEKQDALAGFAIRSQYRIWFRADKSGPFVDWLVLRPRYAKKPVPVILYLNYNGNHEMLPDPEVVIPDFWTRKKDNDHHPLRNRGVLNDPNSDEAFPIGMLLSAGYAVMTSCYCQVSPDPDHDPAEIAKGFTQEEFAYTGVFDLWGKRDNSRDDNTTSLGAWAWSLSRGLDLAEQIPGIDAKRAIVTGYSRLGKSALLAAARDDRFAACVPVQCGGGGATLAKRDYGENVATEMRMFKHWYCPAYRKYERNPAQMLTFDQHLLLAAIAPRKLLIAGFDQPWFDTEGEYLACKAASPAWEFCEKQGLPDLPYPDDFNTDVIGSHLGYYRRSEGHGIADFDWLQLIRFTADMR